MISQNAKKALLLLLCVTAGCGPKGRSERGFLEERAAFVVRKSVALHEAQFPDRPRTNLAEIFQDIGLEYPSDLHNELKKYGDDAGFQHSFYEKYVFVSPGVTNREVRGEIFLLSAEPFQDANGQPTRIAIIRQAPGPTNWISIWLSEDAVRRCFAQLGVPLPKAARTPHERMPAAEKRGTLRTTPRTIEGLFRKLAAEIGIGGNHWLNLLICGVFAMVSVSFLVYFWFHRR